MVVSIALEAVSTAVFVANGEGEEAEMELPPMRPSKRPAEAEVEVSSRRRISSASSSPAALVVVASANFLAFWMLAVCSALRVVGVWVVVISADLDDSSAVFSAGVPIFFGMLASVTLDKVEFLVESTFAVVVLDEGIVVCAATFFSSAASVVDVSAAFSAAFLVDVELVSMELVARG